MKKNSKFNLAILFMILAGWIMPAGLWAQDAKDLEHCKETKAEFIKSDGLLQTLFENSYAYAIFPSIGKGGMGVGGATGNGIVFEKGKAIGKVNMKQLSVGAQLGAQVYREVIFFENNEPLKRLQEGKFEFAGQASAVAVKSGASTNVKYREGVMVFTGQIGGLMYEASIGGQKFSYKAF